MKKLLVLIILFSTLPVYAIEKDKYGIPYCKSEQDYNCRIKKLDKAYWYQVVEQRWTKDGKDLINKVRQIGLNIPYQNYEALCYEYKQQTLEEALKEKEEFLKRRQKEVEEDERKLKEDELRKQRLIEESKKYEKESIKKCLKEEKQKNDDLIAKFIAANNKKPTVPYSIYDRNLQYYKDFCLSDVLACVNNAYSNVLAREFQKNGNRPLNAITEQQLYNEVFNFYAITYRQRWQKGYYIEASPLLWGIKKPN